MSKRARHDEIVSVEHKTTIQSVYIVDDDADIRYFIELVAGAIGVSFKSYQSVEEFFSNYSSEYAGCIISDILMPNIGGLEFQQQLIRKDISLPIILMSAYGDVKTVKSALQNGAVDFLEKPLVTTELSKAIFVALDIDQRQQQEQHADGLLKARLNCLTGRERQILDRLMSGDSNVLLADALHISLRTVETHRNNIIKKMHADSFQDLLRTLLLSSCY